MVQDPQAASRAVAVIRLSACVLVREPCAGNPHARFDGRGVETGQGSAIEAPTTERVGNRYAEPTPPRHTSTLLSVAPPGLEEAFRDSL